MANFENLDLFFSLTSFNEAELKDKTAVVIDVLHSGTSIVTSLMNGADAIIPVADMGEASKIAMNVNSEKYLLCGEKDGTKIDGYDLFNSPFEYSADIVANKKLILNTTNGSKVIKKAFGSSNLYIASFLNVTAIVEHLKKQESDIVLVCGGWKGHLAIEDMLLAGMIIDKLLNGNLPEKVRDGVRTAFTLYDTYKDDMLSVIRNGSQSERLSELNASDVIDYCCQIDITDALPYLDERMIVCERP